MNKNWLDLLFRKRLYAIMFSKRSTNNKNYEGKLNKFMLHIKGDDLI